MSEVAEFSTGDVMHVLYDRVGKSIWRFVAIQELAAPDNPWLPTSQVLVTITALGPIISALRRSRTTRCCQKCFAVCPALRNSLSLLVCASIAVWAVLFSELAAVSSTKAGFTSSRLSECTAVARAGVLLNTAPKLDHNTARV